MGQVFNKIGRTEQWMGFVVLLSLAAIAIGVWHTQFSFNPAVLVGTTAAPEPAKTAAISTTKSMPTLPPELVALSAPELFTADNLYDKVDGKAELYTTAGFVGLESRRYALKKTNDIWMEWCVYDMGTLPQAYSVFSLQRRPEGQNVSLTPFAYKSENALFFVCGQYYIEATASTADPKMMSAMLAFGQQFVAAHPPGDMRIPELALFPQANLVADSQNLQVASAFGFDGFTNVFTAKYHVNNADVQAFFELTKSPADATALCNAYRSFLLANGGKEIETNSAASLGKPINFMDGFEIVFAQGSALAGIHAAPDAISAGTVAQELADKLQKGKP
jgi:hypothetical protein